MYEDVIAQVRGKLLEKDLDRIEVLTPGGVAYELAIPLSVYETLRRERVERIVHSGASAANPKPPAPGPRQPSSADWLLKHHIDWDTSTNADLL